jgi:hypothetical protein
MMAPDGKMRLTDVVDTEQLLRLIQSIPSPKAEPFKFWLALEGGCVAGEARHNIEQRSGRPVITPKNALNFIELLGRGIECGDKGNDTKGFGAVL